MSLQTVGTIGGAVVGGYFGGPGGAAAGASAGGSIGGALDSERDGGSGGGGGGLDEVNPAELIALQNRINRIDSRSPLLNLTFQRDADGNPISSSTSFSPALQRFFDRAKDFEEFESIDSRVGDLSGERKRIEDALFERTTRLLNPEFDRQERTLRDRLVNQGIPIESEASLGDFGELTRFNRGRNNSLRQAALDAVLAGGQEASRVRGEARADLSLERAGRQQDFGEFLQLLQAGSGTIPQARPVDVTGPFQLASQRDLAIFAANNQRDAAKKQGMGQLGAAAILSQGSGDTGSGAQTA